jgi:hypothetical protein
MDPGPARFRNSLCPIHRGLIAMSGYLETLPGAPSLTQLQKWVPHPFYSLIVERVGGHVRSPAASILLQKITRSGCTIEMRE